MDNLQRRCRGVCRVSVMGWYLRRKKRKPAESHQELQPKPPIKAPPPLNTNKAATTTHRRCSLEHIMTSEDRKHREKGWRRRMESSYLVSVQAWWSRVASTTSLLEETQKLNCDVIGHLRAKCPRVGLRLRLSSRWHAEGALNCTSAVLLALQLRRNFTPTCSRQMSVHTSSSDEDTSASCIICIPSH